MEKRTKRKASGQDRGQARRYRVIREQVSPRQHADIRKGPSLRQTCFDCIFCISNALLWAQTLVSGFPVAGQCVNHPDSPGQLRRIPHTPCRNFRAKPFRLDPPESPNDKIRYIPLTRGLFAIVDAEDYEWLSKYKWYAGRPTRAGKIYARRSTRTDGVMLMHRMIMNPPKGMVVDHINGNTLDNRRCNLWVCTQGENIQNSGLHKGAKNRFKGVYPNGRKWYGRVKYKGETYYLGLFDDEVEAAKARDRKALELYGKHAWLNFPPEDPEAGEQ